MPIPDVQEARPLKSFLAILGHPITHRTQTMTGLDLLDLLTLLTRLLLLLTRREDFLTKFLVFLEVLVLLGRLKTPLRLLKAFLEVFLRLLEVLVFLEEAFLAVLVLLLEVLVFLELLLDVDLAFETTGDSFLSDFLTEMRPTSVSDFDSDVTGVLERAMVRDAIKGNQVMKKSASQVAFISEEKTTKRRAASSANQSHSLQTLKQHWPNSQSLKTSKILNPFIPFQVTCFDLC